MVRPVVTSNWHRIWGVKRLSKEGRDSFEKVRHSPVNETLLCLFRLIANCFLSECSTLYRILNTVHPIVSSLCSNQNVKGCASKPEQSSLLHTVLICPLHINMYIHSNICTCTIIGKTLTLEILMCKMFVLKNYHCLWTFNLHSITYYVRWKYFMCSIFVVLGQYENLLKAKISQIMLQHNSLFVY